MAAFLYNEWPPKRQGRRAIYLNGEELIALDPKLPEVTWGSWDTVPDIFVFPTPGGGGLTGTIPATPEVRARYQEAAEEVEQGDPHQIRVRNRIREIRRGVQERLARRRAREGR